MDHAGEQLDPALMDDYKESQCKHCRYFKAPSVNEMRGKTLEDWDDGVPQDSVCCPSAFCQASNTFLVWRLAGYKDTGKSPLGPGSAEMQEIYDTNVVECTGYKDKKFNQ